MSGVDDPSVRRLRLGAELRKKRESAGLTQRATAQLLEWSLSKVTRIESGAHGVSMTDLRALLAAYGVTAGSAVDEFRELARGTRGQPWWQDYRDIVSPQCARFFGYEDAATSYRVSHPNLIPGLLHTRDYAAALLKDLSPPDRTERILKLRSDRQARVFENQEVRHEFFLSEAALEPWIGGPVTMRRQLLHLIEAMDRPNISARVIPHRAGAHPGLYTPLVILGLEEEAGGHVVFMEGVPGDQLIRDDEKEIGRYVAMFDKLRAAALSREHTTALVEAQIRRLEQEA